MTGLSKSNLSLIVLAVMIAGSLYWTLGRTGKEELKNIALTGDCAGAKSISLRLAPLAQGEVAGVVPEKTPKTAPDLHFLDANNIPHNLTDFHGKNILLNLWATWCVPCRKEMPALDRLQAIAGDQDFEVLAINTDTARLEKRQEFLTQAGIKNLGFYADPQGDTFQKMKSIGKAFGLPTSVLIDKTGCMVATLEGPAEWDSEDAQKLIGALKK